MVVGKPEEDVAAIVEPAKVMRIGRMISRLLDEVKDAPLDDASRERLREIYTQSIDELAGGLDAELAEELRRITSPFAPDGTPSDAELRVAQAQLVGWLEGLFQGLQTALMAQQVAARSQVEQMRKALGGRPSGPGPAEPPGAAAGAAGMYL
ncbi:MAG: bacterial proteasome activator family protein [Propionibacteriaceae bacterium]|nr:bacterial proteasome activator family protein [Propionibacteriaceae bacterium]